MAGVAAGADDVIDGQRQDRQDQDPLRRAEVAAVDADGEHARAGERAGAVGHAAAAVQFAAHAAGAMCRGVLLRRHAGNGLEYPVEVERTQASRFRQLLERGWCLCVLDQPTGFGDHRRLLFLQGRLIGLAALARTKAGPFCGGGGVVERHIFGPRWARRAGWAAVHAGGAHGIEEPAVGACITRLHRDPARGVQRGCNKCNMFLGRFHGSSFR